MIAFSGAYKMVGHTAIGCQAYSTNGKSPPTRPTRKTAVKNAGRKYMDNDKAAWCQNLRLWLDFRFGSDPRGCFDTNMYRRGCIECGYYEERPKSIYYLNRDKLIRRVFSA